MILRFLMFHRLCCILYPLLHLIFLSVLLGVYMIFLCFVLIILHLQCVIVYSYLLQIQNQIQSQYFHIELNLLFYILNSYSLYRHRVPFLYLLLIGSLLMCLFLLFLVLFRHICLIILTIYHFCHIHQGSKYTHFRCLIPLCIFHQLYHQFFIFKPISLIQALYRLYKSIIQALYRLYKSFIYPSYRLYKSIIQALYRLYKRLICYLLQLFIKGLLCYLLQLFIKGLYTPLQIL